MEEEHERQKKIYEENQKASKTADDEGLFFPDQEVKDSRTVEMPGLSRADELKEEEDGIPVRIEYFCMTN
jgi:hypothetical protein